MIWWILLNLWFAHAKPKPTVYDNSCLIAVSPNHMRTIHNCAHINKDGSIKVNQPILKDVKFTNAGLVAMMIDKNCYWAHRSGRGQRAHCFEGGPDAFQEGLARYIGRN